MADIEISFIDGRKSKYAPGEVNVTVLDSGVLTVKTEEDTVHTYSPAFWQTITTTAPRR